MQRKKTPFLLFGLTTLRLEYWLYLPGSQVLHMMDNNYRTLPYSPPCHNYSVYSLYTHLCARIAFYRTPFPIHDPHALPFPHFILLVEPSFSDARCSRAPLRRQRRPAPFVNCLAHQLNYLVAEPRKSSNRDREQGHSRRWPQRLQTEPEEDRCRRKTTEVELVVA